jgi:hypothetical protein
MDSRLQKGVDTWRGDLIDMDALNNVRRGKIK